MVIVAHYNDTRVLRYFTCTRYHISHRGCDLTLASSTSDYLPIIRLDILANSNGVSISSVRADPYSVAQSPRNHSGRPIPA